MKNIQACIKKHENLQTVEKFRNTEDCKHAKTLEKIHKNEQPFLFFGRFYHFLTQSFSDYLYDEYNAKYLISEPLPISLCYSTLPKSKHISQPLQQSRFRLGYIWVRFG